MIAQIFTSTGPTGEMPAELRKFAEGSLAEARQRDGVEANASVRDPATGDTVTIFLFRDQAALEAYQAWSEEKIAQAEALGSGEISPGRVYPDVVVNV
jgi:hypothetical protein